MLDPRPPPVSLVANTPLLASSRGRAQAGATERPRLVVARLHAAMRVVRS
jgi:hypothetical protein